MKKEIKSRKKSPITFKEMAYKKGWKELQKEAEELTEKVNKKNSL